MAPCILSKGGSSETTVEILTALDGLFPVFHFGKGILTYVVTSCSMGIWRKHPISILCNLASGLGHFDGWDMLENGWGRQTLRLLLDLSVAVGTVYHRHMQSSLPMSHQQNENKHSVVSLCWGCWKNY